MPGFYTMEDFRTSFNLFCCVYGIGTLGMPGNYARAGPVYATIALLFMAAANIYASIAASKVMLIAPKTVRTFGDLGTFAMGPFGGYAVAIAQLANCLLIPCAFLVLGGILLDILMPDALSQSGWIILMAISILPVSLQPTLQETAAAAFAGCLGTLIADFVGLGILAYYVEPNGESVVAPQPNFKQVVSVFGNLSLAYGAGIVIPALQRQHSDPTRMPKIIFCTLLFISVLFMGIAITGYSIVGCQIPGNLLFAVAGSKLGFSANRGSIVIAFLAMQLHITIAFSVILHPALYIMERTFLGMHKKKGESIETYVEEEKRYSQTSTPNQGTTETVEPTKRASMNSVVSMADIADAELDDHASYNSPGARFKSIAFRLVIITVLVILSIVLREHFLDFVDFVGASAVSVSCIILPTAFYVKVFWTKIPIYEKLWAAIVISICSCLGVYLTYTFGKALFYPASGGVNFPYCPADYQNMVFSNTTHYGH